MESLVRSALPEADVKDVTHEIGGIFTQDLLEEMRHSHSKLAGGVVELTIDVISGLLNSPFSTMLSGAKKIVGYHESNISWLTIHHRLVNRW